MSLLWSKYPCHAKTNLQSVKYYRSIPPVAKFAMGWAQAFGLGKSLHPWALYFSITSELAANPSAFDRSTQHHLAEVLLLRDGVYERREAVETISCAEN